MTKPNQNRPIRPVLIPLFSGLTLGITGCANWDYTMIRDEFKKCNQIADNRISGGQVLEGMDKSLNCGQTYSQKLIDRFGTDDPKKINVEPIW